MSVWPLVPFESLEKMNIDVYPWNNLDTDFLVRSNWITDNEAGNKTIVKCVDYLENFRYIIIPIYKKKKKRDSIWKYICWNDGKWPDKNGNVPFLLISKEKKWQWSGRQEVTLWNIH